MKLARISLPGFLAQSARKRQIFTLLVASLIAKISDWLYNFILRDYPNSDPHLFCTNMSYFKGHHKSTTFSCSTWQPILQAWSELFKPNIFVFVPIARSTVNVIEPPDNMATLGQVSLYKRSWFWPSNWVTQDIKLKSGSINLSGYFVTWLYVLNYVTITMINNYLVYYILFWL